MKNLAIIFLLLVGVASHAKGSFSGYEKASDVEVRSCKLVSAMGPSFASWDERRCDLYIKGAKVGTFMISQSPKFDELNNLQNKLRQARARLGESGQVSILLKKDTLSVVTEGEHELANLQSLAKALEMELRSCKSQKQSLINIIDGNSATRGHR